MKKIATLITALMCVFAFSTAALADNAPDFELDALDGDEYSLDDLLEGNSLLIIDFWQVGCKPCDKLLPYLQEYYDEFADDGVEVVIISRDTALTLPMVEPFFSANDYSFKVLLDTELDVSQDFGVKASPATFMITPDGELIFSHFGYTPGQEVEYKEAIEQYLESGDISVELEPGETS